ncbi:MAG: two-component system response regulator [Desulfobacteraceae bacterium IS3]|jgi:two-component system chemotaxis response regulator CheY|nr:MAG: two-component system response regulator [Desulfobacteraceae bacterium IS3]HAO23342.1 response regulator [Desulfobacteraceae bacterium]
MRALIAEDDFIARKYLKEILSPYGDCDVVVDGQEAVQAFRLAWDEKKPYDLICLDIMMPNMDGHQALKEIREIERTIGIKGSSEVKVIMVTALGDPKNVFEAYYKGGATSYIVKPVDRAKLIEEVRSFCLI